MEGTENPLLITEPHYSIRLFGRNLSDYLKERQKTTAKSLGRFRRRIVPWRHPVSVLSQVYPVGYQVITNGIRPFTSTRHAFSPGSPVFRYVGVIPSTFAETFSLVLSEFREAVDYRAAEASGGDDKRILAVVFGDLRGRDGAGLNGLRQKLPGPEIARICE